MYDFNKAIKEHELSLLKNKRIFSILGYIKLAIALMFLYFFYLSFSKSFPTYLIFIDIALIIIFTILAFVQNHFNDKVLYDNGIISINKKNLDRISGDWSKFKDIGQEFVDVNHHYSSDLDIVGNKSLFQFLNSTHTYHGRIMFANDLLNANYSKEEIINRQEAVKELSKEIEFSNHIEYYLSKISSDHSTKKLLDELKDNKKCIKSKIIKLTFTYLPLLTILITFIILALQINSLYPFILILFLIQLAIWVTGIIKLQYYLNTITYMPYKLSAYNKVIEILNSKEFSSSKLIDIQSRFCAKDISVSQAIKELAIISNMISVKHNGLIYFVLNVMFLWDYQCVFLLEKWKEKYSNKAEDWFIALGEFESLLSLSKLSYVCSNTSIPTIIDEDKKIIASDIGHPLIGDNIRVNNNFSLDNNIFIISGSNMSGKTTFLRTVGINLVLAKAGGFVLAKEMSCSLLSIVTSMRIADNLNEGISTFYAELKRIKEIVNSAQKDDNLIFLIDEIFKGTNSVDRISGAKTVLTNLSSLKSIGIITTHELELCSLEASVPNIVNYSFSEHYSDKGIEFDYKIKKGKSTTTNAEYLMKMIGLL